MTLPCAELLALLALAALPIAGPAAATLALLALGTVFAEWFRKHQRLREIGLKGFRAQARPVRRPEQSIAKRTRADSVSIDTEFAPAVGSRHLIVPLLREHAASFYHLGCEVTRYYGLVLLVIGAVYPPLWPVIAFLLLVGPLYDHRRHKPALSLPAFIGLYWLEMASYQLGVWHGCLKRHRWRPLFPRIRWRF